MSAPPSAYLGTALDHLRYLSTTLGARGSCTYQERQAAQYVAACMENLGVSQVRLQPFRGAPSTYRPFALAFTAALFGTLFAWIFPSWLGFAFASLLNALGAWAMFAETDFLWNWARSLSPSAPSRNVVAVVPAAGAAEKQVVLCAHLDTHRTPIFYSSRGWYLLFSLLVGLAFASMLAAGALYALAAFFAWGWALWAGLAAAAMQLFALVLCLHADFTPFSPGANDNASGVGLILALAEALLAEPLPRTQVHLLFTGCEETGAHGMTAFLDAHAAELGEQCLYIALDQVGIGALTVLTRDGLILKRPTHPQALRLAEKTAAALAQLKVEFKPGLAYTDAAAATKRGLVALTLVAIPPPGQEHTARWHQLSDTVDWIDSRSLEESLAFTWQALRQWDSEG